MSSKSNKGFSLVELMIALVAGLIVSGAVVVFAMASMKSNGDFVQTTRLTQELRNTLELATRDLRRAGYDDNALQYVGAPNASPFAPLSITTTTEADGTTSSCVLYAYDRAGVTNSGWGVLNLDNGEMRGLRRKQATINGRTIGVIEYAVSDGGGSKPACDDGALNYSNVPVACVGQWCPLSDSRNLDITEFSVVNSGPADLTAGTGSMRIRSLDVAIAGRLAGRTDVQRRISSRVRVQADCILATFANCQNASP